MPKPLSDDTGSGESTAHDSDDSGSVHEPPLLVVHCLNQLSDSTELGSELQFMETMWDEIAPESSDGEVNWDEEDSRASSGTSLLQRSRRTEDTDNPHWSSRWAGWGIRLDSEESVPETDSTNNAMNDVAYYLRAFPHLTVHSSDYSPDSDYRSRIRCTGRQTFVSHVADEDDETSDMENESEVSLERATGTPRSLYTSRFL
jgi:hypothetical protein